MLMQYRVPAADAKISQQAMNETFYLSNIAPQVGDGFNRHCKSPTFEEYPSACQDVYPDPRGRIRINVVGES